MKTLLTMIVAAFAIALLPSSGAAQANQKIEFTKEEADFLAYLVLDGKQIAQAKAILRFAEATDIPMNRADFAALLMKKSIEARFGAPDIEEAFKGLDKIKCAKNSEHIQFFIQGQHPEVKGRASGRNKKFFEDLLKCYERKN